MEEQPIKLPEVIATKLAQFERRRKAVLLLRALAESLLILGGGLLLVVLLEWLFKPQLTGRIWLSWANYFIAGGWLIYRAGLLLQSSSLRQIAGAFETAAQQRFQERILSAVEMTESPQPGSQPGVSAWMMGKTISLAAEEIRQVNPGAFVDPAPARRAWKAAAGLLLGLGLACLLPGFGARARLALAPYASTAPLSKIKLAVQPGSCRLKQGTPLEIKVSANEPLDQARVVVNWEDGFRETVPMSRDSTNGFVLGLPAVSQGFRYFVEALDAESAVFTVKVDVPPRIARMQLLVQPPSYTQWSNRVVEGGSADFLLGSRVRLNVETTGEKVASAEFLAEGVSTQKLSLDNNRLTLDLQPTNAITYQLRLTGANRLPAEPGPKWTLRPLPDEPPVARLAGVGTESALVQQDELLLLQAQASDDVGLKRVDLLVLSKEAAADVKTLFPVKPQAAAADNRELKASLNYNLADLQAFPGDEVQFQLVATDVRDQTTRSDLLALTIGSPDKAAEAQMVERIKQLVSAMEAQIEYLKQTRTSWLSIGRNFKEDAPEAQRPAFTVLKSRLNEFGRELNLIGSHLVAQSETNHLAESRFMYRLGTTLSAWGKQQREVLLENCARLDQAKAGAVVEVIDQGRELFNRALVDMEQYRRVLTVLQGAFQTDVLATRCDSAQGRYKRGLPILRGQTNALAQADSTGPGLKASFFEGLDLRGRLLEQKIVNPRFDNYAPANRREQWSARYEGEINLSEAGEWTLGCLADDGVRLNLDGKSLLPPEAWAPHAATQFKADLKLTAGWHRVVLEFFQGGSESKLQFLAGKKGQALQEVPVAWLRPPLAPPKPQVPTDPALTAIVKNALHDRVRNSLQTPTVVPPAVALITNAVQNENLSRLTTEKLPVGAALGSNLLSFSSWKLEEGQKAESQADELTAFSKEAQRLLREELEKYRWRYEGAAALKEMQTAIQELREINQDLRRMPYLPRSTHTEAQLAKVALAKTWEKQLEKATREATHNLFETAKQKEATLAERTLALNATTKAEKELQPAIDKLAKTLEEDRHKDEMVNQVDQRLNEISDRYRELNDLQERLNREHVAAEARKALPPARAFARSQQAQKPDAPADYDKMKQAVAEVQKAQRVIGDYQGAEKLDSLLGHSAPEAKGKETAQEIRDLAMRTDNNPPSLAQTIPPPLQQQTDALTKQPATASQSANELAKPRLAMALEAARLNKQGDRKAAVAYDLLGQDTGELLATPAKLTAQALKPIAERAAALAGQKGEEARQAEIKAANQRLEQLAKDSAANQQALASQLDELSAMAAQAAGADAKRQPLTQQLGELAGKTPTVPNYAESANAQEVAASAAQESLNGIQAAPKAWEAYNDASQILADAARQIRMDSAMSQMDQLNPYPSAEMAQESDLTTPAASLQDQASKTAGSAGQALTQPVPKGIDQAEWARLNERLRQAIRSSGIENFSEEQQTAIRAYFERLSSDK